MTQMTITAERRVLMYEDYDIPLETVRECWREYFCRFDNLKTMDYIRNLVIRWDEDENLATIVTFELPDGTEFTAYLKHPSPENERWSGEIIRETDEKGMRRDDIIWKVPDEQPIKIKEVVTVLIAASAILMECEDAHYP